ncbi:MAG: erythrose-4-phosphate dehydrogenase [Halioglobus sp.]|nr:erythrose-4-phosphate dehydrogenase [Halioglobus sp.]
MLRLAINGYGRIGRSLLRALYESRFRHALSIVAINELADAGTVLHLTRYDSTQGRFPLPLDGDAKNLRVDGDNIALLSHARIGELPWKELGVDIVMECTGAFSDRATAALHLERGAEKVLFSQPAQPDVDMTVVYGVNHQRLSAQHRIVSNASCTTNAIVPVIKALDGVLGIEYGTITTIHSAMNDQPVLDAYHHTDLRKTRAASHSVIPVDTELAKGITRLLPDMAGRFSAQALRVPTLNVSALDLTVQTRRDTDVIQVNRVLRDASQSGFEGVLGYTEELLASCDFNHDPRSGVVDASQTRVSGRHLVKVLTWFDNEWGFANRMLDVAGFWGGLD